MGPVVAVEAVWVAPPEMREQVAVEEAGVLELAQDRPEGGARRGRVGRIGVVAAYDGTRDEFGGAGAVQTVGADRCAGSRRRGEAVRLDVAGGIGRVGAGGGEGEGGRGHV
jgi:hypothetical protein